MEKQKFLNKWLRVRSNIIFFLKLKVNDIKAKHFGKLELHDDFTTMSKNQFSDKYHLGQPWGYYHPEQLYQWYDKSARKLTEKGLELFLTDNVYKENSVVIERGIGLAASKYELSYGLYEWEVQPPQGKELWWAMWLTNAKTWPPEIDVVEGFTDSSGKCGDRFETNFHTGVSPEHFNLGAIAHAKHINDKRPINFKCLWTKDSINIYYNNVLVRKLIDKTQIAFYNTHPYMINIMGHGLQKSLPLSEQNVSPVIVKYFKHYGLK